MGSALQVPWMKNDLKIPIEAYTKISKILNYQPFLDQVYKIKLNSGYVHLLNVVSSLDLARTNILLIEYSFYITV